MANTNKYTLGVGVKLNTAGVQTQLNNLSKTSTITTTIKLKGGQEGLKTVDTYKNSLGQTVKVTEKFDETNKSMGKSVTSMSQKLDKSSNSIKQMGSDFVTTTAKVAKFALSTAVIGLFTGAIAEAVTIVKDFDDALTDFKKVSDLSGEALDDYTVKLGELGAEVARTRTEMVSAATEFKKSGFTDEESAQLAQIASLYQNVADSELSAGDSASYIISQMKAFDISAEDAISIIDKTNEVSNNFAVSSTDISTALTKTSSALGAYGNTIDETIGMITAGSEVMTGQASKVSKGLNFLESLKQHKLTGKS